MSMSSNDNKEIATLAGGCFWCLEAVFDDLKGVEQVESGYSGGAVANPSYRQVCTGRTGHAEVVQITFDPQVISYRDLRIEGDLDDLRSEEHTSELQSHSDLHSFPTRRSSDLGVHWSHWPRRGRPDHLRSAGHQLPRPADRR